MCARSYIIAFQEPFDAVAFCLMVRLDTHTLTHTHTHTVTHGYLARIRHTKPCTVQHREYTSVCVCVSIGLTEHTDRGLARVGLTNQDRTKQACMCVCVCVHSHTEPVVASPCRMARADPEP